MFSNGEMLERLVLRARILAVHVATLFTFTHADILELCTRTDHTLSFSISLAVSFDSLLVVARGYLRHLTPLSFPLILHR